MSWLNFSWGHCERCGVLLEEQYDQIGSVLCCTCALDVFRDSEWCEPGPELDELLHFP